MNHLGRRFPIAVVAGALLAVCGCSGSRTGRADSTATTATIPLTTSTSNGRPSSTVTSPTTTPATAAPPASTTTTTAPPQVVAAQLAAFVASEAARYQASARAGGQVWNGYLVSPVESEGGRPVALAAFSYDPGHSPVQVLDYTSQGWRQEAALPAPAGSPPTSYWVATFAGAAITTADVTGDGRPDFLVPLLGADNVPGAVLSQDGATSSAGWRWVPFAGGGATAEIIGRNPRIAGSHVVTQYNDCNPDCAGGKVSDQTWSYQRTTGDFVLASGPSAA